MSLTTDPKDPRLGHGSDQEQVPQNEVYLVLSEEEIAKGFVRPLRTTYVHVGKKVELEDGTIRPLTDEEKERYASYNYAAFLEYPESRHPVVGKFLFQEEVDHVGEYIGGCGHSTKMDLTISATYARDPKFYGSTYCCYCRKHLDVNEFVWEGTNEKVGS